jgi:hypothetical protein
MSFSLFSQDGDSHNFEVTKMTKKELSKEKEIRILEFSSTPTFVVLFILLFYFLYLKTIGVDLSESSLMGYLFSAIFASLAVCFALNEFLLKVYEGRFKFKRLLFRWMLIALFALPLSGAYLFLSILFPWASTYHQMLFGGLIATGIFVTVILKCRNLFNKLDTGEW